MCMRKSTIQNEFSKVHTNFYIIMNVYGLVYPLYLRQEWIGSFFTNGYYKPIEVRLVEAHSRLNRAVS